MNLEKDGSPAWEQQYLRMNRWFVLFRETNFGRPHLRESDFYQDEAYSFFQNCYHLKDWLKNDNSVQEKFGDIEKFIKGSINLRICADLCNGSKHLLLSNPKHSKDTQITRRHYNLDLGGAADKTISAKYSVISGGKSYDAFTIAEKCMDEWNTYLIKKGLLAA